MFKIPKNYRCPITSQIMVDPVFTADGHTYEHEAIEEWLKTHDASPKTGLILANKLLTPNWDKKGDIVEFIEQHVELYETEEIYLPKTCVEQLLIAINNNQTDLVRKLLVQERRLLIYDLITQPTIVIADLAQSEEPATTISNKLISNVENTLIEDSSISNTTPLSKNTAFYFASQFGSPELLEVILEQLQRTNQLHKQLATSTPTNFRPTHLNTLLQKTLLQNDKEKFMLLLQLGADIEQPADDVGNTLLHRMIINDNKEAIELLVEHGALLESCNLDGNTPLSLAVLHSHTTIVESLIARGANPTVACGAEQLTPLHIAAKHGYINIVTILLQANVQIDAVNILGDTPLHLAAKAKQESVILSLLAAGAYHKARNYTGLTPIDIERAQNRQGTSLIAATARQIKQDKLEEINTLRQKVEFLENKVSILSVTARTNIVIEEGRPREILKCQEYGEFSQILFLHEQQTSLKQCTKFLRHIGFGEQDEAEAMLNINPNLVLQSGVLTDCARRQFNEVTGFQYALWALDWHMWTMLKKYLPEESAREQIKGLEQGAWVEEHGIAISWQNLIDALQKYVNNYKSWTVEQSQGHWCKQVGGAQLILPAHVINEYSHPSRPLYPCFKWSNEEATLPRTGVADWAGSSDCKLGGGFAWARANRPTSCIKWGAVATLECPAVVAWGTRCSSAPIQKDLVAISELLKSRTEQARLLLESELIFRPSSSPRPKF